MYYLLCILLMFYPCYSVNTTFQMHHILMRGFPCLDRGFFVSSLGLSGGRNVTLQLHLC